MLSILQNALERLGVEINAGEPTIAFGDRTDGYSVQAIQYVSSVRESQIEYFYDCCINIELPGSMDDTIINGLKTSTDDTIKFVRLATNDVKFKFKVYVYKQNPELLRLRSL